MMTTGRPLRLGRGRSLALAIFLLFPACAPEPREGGAPPPAAATAPAASASDWCAEHGLPESKCTKCNPSLVTQFQAAGDWCAEHGFPESVCPICHPVAPPPGAPSPKVLAGTRIRFRSPEIERASGIGTDPARDSAMELGVECTARISFDRNRTADVRASVPGVVREVRVDLGRRVRAGDELFVLDSARVGELQGELRAARERVEVARAHHERQLELRETKIASVRQVELAREELEAAAAQLRSIEVGLRIAGASESGAEGRFRVRSPIAGTVVRRPATLGTFANDETSLATVADTSRMWALLEIRESDAAAVRVGRPVSLRVEGVPETQFFGTVTWIASEVDARTRTVAARAEVANDDGLLRAEQFARATIGVEDAQAGVAVPRRAVQRIGEESVVFVRTGAGVYEPRVVTLGRSSADLVEVRGEVRRGDPIVTDGAYLLRTELARESIGAGCCEVTRPEGS